MKKRSIMVLLIVVLLSVLSFMAYQFVYVPWKIKKFMQDYDRYVAEKTPYDLTIQTFYLDEVSYTASNVNRSISIPLYTCLNEKDAAVIYADVKTSGAEAKLTATCSTDTKRSSVITIQKISGKYKIQKIRLNR